jgi:hypothetical protein
VQSFLEPLRRKGLEVLKEEKIQNFFRVLCDFTAKYFAYRFNNSVIVATGIALYQRNRMTEASVPDFSKTGSVLSLFSPQVWMELCIPWSRCRPKAARDMT